MNLVREPHLFQTDDHGTELPRCFESLEIERPHVPLSMEWRPDAL
jgi:hypothetical protein